MKIGGSTFLFCWSLAIHGYAAQTHPRILILEINTTVAVIPQVRGLVDGLVEAGYVDGKNLTIQHIKVERADQLRDRLAHLIAKTVDVIVTTSARETAMAKQLTSAIPIIFVPAIDPVGMGFVKSRARPHANLTGLSFTRDAEDNGKQILMFKQIVPALRRVVTFYDGQPATRTSAAILASVNRVARSLKIELIQYPAISSAEAAQILLGMPQRAMDGVFVICSATYRGIKPLADRATEKGVPLFGCTTTQVAEEGALMTYTPDIYYMGYRGAWYVDRILKGAKPRELPVETPTKFELAVNLKTARRLGVKIPPEALILADRVFQ